VSTSACKDAIFGLMYVRMTFHAAGLVVVFHSLNLPVIRLKIESLFPKTTVRIPN